MCSRCQAACGHCMVPITTVNWQCTHKSTTTIGSAQQHSALMLSKCSTLCTCPLCAVDGTVSAQAKALQRAHVVSSSGATRQDTVGTSNVAADQEDAAIAVAAANTDASAHVGPAGLHVAARVAAAAAPGLACTTVLPAISSTDSTLGTRAVTKRPAAGEVPDDHLLVLACKRMKLDTCGTCTAHSSVQATCLFGQISLSLLKVPCPKQFDSWHRLKAVLGLYPCEMQSTTSRCGYDAPVHIRSLCMHHRGNSWPCANTYHACVCFVCCRLSDT